MIYAANKRANGSQDFASCISICFPNVFFSLSLLGSWSLGFVASLGFFLPEELSPHGLTIPGKREEVCQQEAVTQCVLYS